MPVGAAIGVGVVGAAGTAYAGSKNAKAINKSTDAQTQSNAQSLALQREVYGENKAVLAPFVQRGNVAGGTFNALLGLGGSNDNAQQLPTAQPNALAALYQGANPDTSGGVMGAPGAFSPAFRNGVMGGDLAPNEFWQSYMRNPGQVPTTPGYGGTMPPATGNGGLTAQQAANNAFDIFRNSTNYKWRFGEGMDALNSGWAGAGTLQSGAAMKDALEYGQNFASNELNNYFGLLGNQQGVGLSAASAQAGVSQGYANNVSALNQSNANALSNAAVARANNTNALIGGFGNALGGAVGILQGAGKL